MPESFIDSPPPAHVHPPTEVTQLVSWQASIERSQAAARRDIELLKKGFLTLIIVLFFFAIMLLVMLG